jgi:hypothetical protein
MRIESKKTILEFDKNSKESFDLVKRKLAGLGKEPNNESVFMFAMAYGFMNGNKVDSVTRSGTGARVEYLKPENELLMAAIQLAETGKVESLLNQEEQFDLAERYAEGGIRLLKLSAEEQGDFLQDISAQMNQLFRSLNTED